MASSASPLLPFLTLLHQLHVGIVVHLSSIVFLDVLVPVAVLSELPDRGRLVSLVLLVVLVNLAVLVVLVVVLLRYLILLLPSSPSSTCSS